jgi:hypothetical protein
MNYLLDFFQTPQAMGNLSSTLILFASVLLFRIVVLNTIRKSSLIPEGKRKWVIQIKNASLIFLIFGLVVIWASELRNFALSLVAIAAALAICVKEIILCFMGGVYKASIRAFEVGDRIQVGVYRGDVLDHDLLSTRLYEIGPGDDMHQFTGKVVTIPNALFLSNSIRREAKVPFDLHTFVIPIAAGLHWKELESKLYASCHKECDSYLQEAKRYMRKVQEREGIDVPDLDPRISVRMPSYKEWQLVVRIPVQGLRKSRIEQAILKDFFESLDHWPQYDGEEYRIPEIKPPSPPPPPPRK